MSLTTKYRPQTLDQVIGQGPVISSLTEVVSKRRAKAFLFVGPSGVGKTTLSRIIARMLCDGKATEANIEEIPAADLSGVDDMRSIVNRSVYRAVGGSPVKCIILDECFIKGTLVDTPDGPIPIEQLRPMDKVLGVFGTQTVKTVIKKYVNEARVVRLHLSDSDIIVCSQEHLFLTWAGWRCAAQLQGRPLVTLDDHIPAYLQSLWDTLHEQWPRLHTLQAMLHQRVLDLRQRVYCNSKQFKTNLFTTMWEQTGWITPNWTSSRLLATGRQTWHSPFSRNKSETCTRIGPSQQFADAFTKSNARPSYSQENANITKTTGDGSWVGWHTWGKWNRANQSPSITTLAYRWGTGISSYYWRWAQAAGLASCLQSRYWVSRAASSCRNWFVVHDRAAKNRYSAHSSIKVIRVDGYPILKSDGSYPAKSGCSRSQTLLEFYDLEIIEHPTYSVKGLIVHNCHRLSYSAMQMLLKPIEEPPPHVYWFLCTTELGKIPKTIQTRCLRYDLKAVDDVLIYELLIDITKKEGLNVNESIVEAVAENAGGSVRQAIQYLELVQTCKDVNEARAAINTASGSREAIDIAKWLVKGENLTWQEGMQRVTALENPDPESIRITLVRYISAVAVKSKGQRTGYYLHLLSCFSEPFNPSDGIAGLLVAIGLALGIDRQ